MTTLIFSLIGLNLVITLAFFIVLIFKHASERKNALDLVVNLEKTFDIQTSVWRPHNTFMDMRRLKNSDAIKMLFDYLGIELKEEPGKMFFTKINVDKKEGGKNGS